MMVKVSYSHVLELPDGSEVVTTEASVIYFERKDTLRKLSELTNQQQGITVSEYHICECGVRLTC